MVTGSLGNSIHMCGAGAVAICRKELRSFFGTLSFIVACLSIRKTSLHSNHVPSIMDLVVAHVPPEILARSLPNL